MEYSFLMSCYIGDEPSDLRAALHSIKLQTLPAAEIVLIEDGILTEELYAVIEEYKTKLPIKTITLETNKGLGAALKIGIEACKYDIIARTDADDICAADRMQKQITFLTQNPSISAVGAWIEEFTNEPGDLKRIKKVPESADEIERYSRSRNPFNHQTVVFRKQKVLECGSYRPMLYFEDYYLWMRMLKMEMKLHNLQETLMYAKVGNDMVGRRHGLKYAQLEYLFWKQLFKEDILKLIEFVNVIVRRLPLRLLPKPLMNLLYAQLRKL